MKIAFPVCRKEISPRFDLSFELGVITGENGKVIQREKISIGKLDMPQQIEKLVLSGADDVVCGGIHNFSLERRRGMRISRIIHHGSGWVNIALAIFLQGGLKPGASCAGGRKSLM
jgi:hypothetical protein